MVQTRNQASVEWYVRQQQLGMAHVQMEQEMNRLNGDLEEMAPEEKETEEGGRDAEEEMRPQEKEVCAE